MSGGAGDGHPGHRAAIALPLASTVGKRFAGAGQYPSDPAPRKPCIARFKPSSPSGFTSPKSRPTSRT